MISPSTLTLSPEDYAFCAAQSADAGEYVHGLIAQARARSNAPSQSDAPDPNGGLHALVQVMARLRDPQGGCPWDLEQTHQTLKKYVIEEAYEVVEAVDLGSAEKLCEELGDLVLQAVFHAQLAAEAAQFTIEDVTRGITNKLIRRHPHVFGDAQVDNAEHVLRNWEQIKRAEHGNRERESILDGIPPALPALMRALEVSRRVVKVGFEWPGINQVLDKVQEEIGELRAEIAQGDTARAADELGDLLFTLVNVARKLGIDPEEALRRMTVRFAARFRVIEKHAAMQGRALGELSLNEMETVWQTAKREHC